MYNRLLRKCILICFFIQENGRSAEFTLEGVQQVKPKVVELQSQSVDLTDADHVKGTDSTLGEPSCSTSSDKIPYNASESSCSIHNKDSKKEDKINAYDDKSQSAISTQSDIKENMNDIPGKCFNHSESAEANIVSKLSSESSGDLDRNGEGVNSVNGGCNKSAGEGLGVNGGSHDCVPTQVNRRLGGTEIESTGSLPDNGMVQNLNSGSTEVKFDEMLEGEIDNHVKENGINCQNCDPEKMDFDTEINYSGESGGNEQENKSENHKELGISDHTCNGDSQPLVSNLEEIQTQSTKTPAKSRRPKRSKSRRKGSSKQENQVTTPKPRVRSKSVNKFVELVPEDKYQPKNIFDHSESVAPKNFFECICGVSDGSTKSSSPRKRKHQVQCVMCGLYQHAECVSYDLEDPFRGQFKCPHCHVLSVSRGSVSHQKVLGKGRGGGEG